MTINYIDLWIEDKESIIATMIRNMQADLNAGYDPMGKSIKDQRAELARYKEEFHALTDKIADIIITKGNKAASDWCRLDLKRRGAIS